MQSHDFVITTQYGSIPHVVDYKDMKCFNRTFQIYVDDFIYNGSYYLNKDVLPIKEFCSVSNDIIVTFKDKSNLLRTRRGNRKFTKDEYIEFIEKANPDFYMDFDTKKIISRGNKIFSSNFIECKNIENFVFNLKNGGKMILNENFIECKNIEDFVFNLKNGGKIFSTNFINEMVNNGQLITYKSEIIYISDYSSKPECSCCSNFEWDYVIHMCDIKEICALTVGMIHNFTQLDNLFKEIQKNILIIDLIKIKKCD
ncbi:hypothetical protein CWI36_2733p0010 [Hamiltosporidium magnivora]|uniref:tRNA-guanine(15) transglycosylase-like domain-containing protein n=1 Tax=Hamiltosporidium magnivora TaxID=148818 RepID=A0A4Q9KSL7_9MICR|nr:hypothetical protein CWI36_2733p0010 [Hamiltosporidium magnivora]